MRNLYRVFEATNINHYLIPYSRYINRVDQLTGGPFYAKTEALYHPEISIFRRRTNQTIREIGRLPNNISSLSFHPAENAFYLVGSYYGFGGISSTKAGYSFESITQKNSTHYTITINENYLHKYFDIDQRRQLENFLEIKRDITSCEELRFEIPEIINEVFDLLATQSEEKLEIKMYNHVCDKVIGVLLKLIHAATFNNLRVNSNAYLVDKVIHTINGSEKPTLSIFDLANKLHTNRRNIETAFRNHLRLSPKEYIINLRLNNIRTTLLHSTKNSTYVSAVAREFGIQHLSNFSKAYYCLFGERPNETLARIPKNYM